MSTSRTFESDSAPASETAPVISGPVTPSPATPSPATPGAKTIEFKSVEFDLESRFAPAFGSNGAGSPPVPPATPLSNEVDKILRIAPGLMVRTMSRDPSPVTILDSPLPSPSASPRTATPSPTIMPDKWVRNIPLNRSATPKRASFSTEGKEAGGPAVVPRTTGSMPASATPKRASISKAPIDSKAIGGSILHSIPRAGVGPIVNYGVKEDRILLYGVSSEEKCFGAATLSDPEKIEACANKLDRDAKLFADEVKEHQFEPVSFCNLRIEFNLKASGRDLCTFIYFADRVAFHLGLPETRIRLVGTQGSGDGAHTFISVPKEFEEKFIGFLSATEAQELLKDHPTLDVVKKRFQIVIEKRKSATLPPEAEAEVKARKEEEVKAAAAAPASLGSASTPALASEALIPTLSPPPQLLGPAATPLPSAGPLPIGPSVSLHGFASTSGGTSAFFSVSRVGSTGGMGAGTPIAPPAGSHTPFPLPQSWTPTLIAGAGRPRVVVLTQQSSSAAAGAPDMNASGYLPPVVEEVSTPTRPASPGRRSSLDD